jgi:hypothetical protein
MTQAHRWLVKWARTLHVYLTLFGFMLMLFFAVTGFMLNHENWFLPTQTTTGTIPVKLLGTPEDRDAIVDVLRGEFGLQGDLDSFDADESTNTFRLRFKSEDGQSEALIQRADGATTVTNNTAKQSRERITISEGTMPKDLLVPDDASKQLPIVERLRKDFGARGEVIGPPQYEKESESFGVVFKAPGYLATATIRASDGQTKVVHQSRGINGILLDLHRGKDSGIEWSVVVDAVAILFVIVSITGFILWTSLRGRAQHGFAVLVIGTIVGIAAYYIWVPR